MQRMVTCTIVLLCLPGYVISQDAKIDAKIDAKADQALKKMCTYLAGLKTFSFESEDTNDVVQDDGRQIQFSNRLHAHLMRPNRIVSEREGDTGDRKSFYDGKTLTVFDRAAKTYAVAEVPPTIDELLDHIFEEYGAASTPPLADLLVSDPDKVFTEHMQSGLYVGLHQVGETPCHHLSFRGTALDWQIWIDAGEKPLPLKIVITYKREAGGPQFTSRITKWTVNPEFEATMFKFQPPRGVTKVKIAASEDE